MSAWSECDCSLSQPLRFRCQSQTGINGADNSCPDGKMEFEVCLEDDCEENVDHSGYSISDSSFTDDTDYYDGKSYASQRAPKPSLPVVPAYTEWTDWSACSKSCGSGLMTRTRSCLKNCSDSIVNRNEVECNTEKCKGNSLTLVCKVRQKIVAVF